MRLGSACLRTSAKYPRDLGIHSQSTVLKTLDKSRVAGFRPYCTLMARLSSSGRCRRRASNSFSTSSSSMLLGFEMGVSSDISASGTSQFSS